MNRGTRSSRRARLVSRALVVVAALAMLWIQLTDPGINGFFAAKFGEMIYGTAFKPYVYRALLPWLTRLIVWTLPAGVKDSLVLTAENSHLCNAAFGAMHLEPAFAPEGVIAIALMFSCLLGFAVTARSLFVTLYAGPPLVAEIVPIAALLGVQTMFNYGNYIYDFPTLFFSSLGLLLLARERWWLFVAAYAVGLLNKETAVLLALLFLFHYFARVPFRTYLTVGVATCVAFVASRVLLNQLYSSNPGAYTIFQLVEHNLDLLHSYPPASVLTAGLVVVFVFGHWSRKPALMRDASLMSIPLLGACAVYGFFDELRDYYEIYPVLVMLVTPTIASVMGVEVTTRAEPRPRMQTRAWLRGQVVIAAGA